MLPASFVALAFLVLMGLAASRAGAGASSLEFLAFLALGDEAGAPVEKKS